MVLLNRATNGIATRAKGAFLNCGSGDTGYELSYSCQGPACSSLDVSFQNILCHKDGSSTLICSNDVKCQPGTSSYQSNFTFSQNEPDPWSPVMENEPDTWIQQDQHVLLGSCAKFSLTSDGTKAGTRVDDEVQADICPNVQKLSLSSASTEAVRATSPTGRSHVGTTSKPLVFAGTGPRYTASRSFLLLAFLITTFLLLPGSQASAMHTHPMVSPQRNIEHARAVSTRIRDFAAGLEAEIVQKVNDSGADAQAFAHNLVATVVSSVCQDHFDDVQPHEFKPVIVKDCVASIYGDGRLLRPATQLLAVFGASLLCDYVVSEIFPNEQEFLPEGCEGLRDVARKIPVDRPTSKASVPTTQSSPDTRFDSVGGLSTVAQSPAPSPFLSAPTQVGAAQSNPSLIDALGFYAHSASGSLSKLQQTSPRLSTDNTFASRPSASTLVPAIPPPADSTLTIPSTLIAPLSLQSSSPRLLSSHMSSSGTVSSQQSLLTPVQSATLRAETTTFHPFGSGVSDTASTVSKWPVSSSKSTLATNLSPLARTSLGLASLEIGESADAPIETLSSTTASPSRASPKELSTMVPSSNRLPEVFEPETFVASQESTLAVLLSSQRSFKSSMTSYQGTYVSMIPTLAALPAAASATHPHPSSLAFMNAPSFAASPASVSPKSSPRYMVPSSVSRASTPSGLMFDLSSFRTRPDLKLTSPESDMSTFASAFGTFSSDTSSHTLSSGPVSHSEPTSSLRSSLSIPMPVASSEPTLSASFITTFSNAANTYASKFYDSNLRSISNFDISALTLTSSMEAISATISDLSKSLPSSYDNVPTNVRESGNSVNKGNTSGISTLANVSSAPSRSKATSRHSLSPAKSLESSTPVLDVLSTPKMSNIVPASGDKPLDFNSVPADGSEPTIASESPSQKALFSLGSDLNSHSSVASITHPAMTSASLGVTSGSVIISSASKLLSASSGYQKSASGTPSSVPPENFFPDHVETSTVSSEGVNNPNVLESGLSENLSDLVIKVSTTKSVLATDTKPSVASQFPSLDFQIATDNVASDTNLETLGESLGFPTFTAGRTVSVSTLVSVRPPSTPTDKASMLPDNTRPSFSDAKLLQDPLTSDPALVGDTFSAAFSSTVKSTDLNSTKAFSSAFPSVFTKDTVAHSPNVLHSSLHAFSTFSPSHASLAPTRTISSQILLILPSSIVLSKPSSALIYSTTFMSPPSMLHTSLTTLASHPITTSFVTVVSISISTSAVAHPSKSTSTACIRNATSSGFCPGSGCVSLLADAAQCGACNQSCMYTCREGICMCPESANPGPKNTCNDNSGDSECVGGYIENGFQVCRPLGPSTSFGVSVQRTILEPKTTQTPVKQMSGAGTSSASVAWIEVWKCPPELPDICDGGCFNVGSEHKHCGGCGRYCSGTCIDGSCFATFTGLIVDSIPTRRTLTTDSSIHPLKTSTAELVALAIVKGLAGPQQLSPTPSEDLPRATWPSAQES